MAFPRKQASELLAQCHRRCCICHRFCGVKMEMDHIVPGGEGGDNSIDNAIPVCFECHAETHCYNDRHPRGRKFLPEELSEHKRQWLELCSNRPEALLVASYASDVGPLQALIDELEFNARVATTATVDRQGCLFNEQQFLRAVQGGAIAVLRDEVKDAVLDAYVAIGSANRLIHAAWLHPKKSEAWAVGVGEAGRRMTEAEARINAAKKQLLGFLGHEIAAV